MRRSPLPRSIRGRLLMLNLLVAVPLVLLAAWQISSLWRQALDRGYRDARAIAERVAADLSGLLRDREIALAAISAQPRVQAMDPRLCGPLFSSMSDFYPDLTAVTVRDGEGRLVCSTLPFAPTELSEELMQPFRIAMSSGRLEVSAALYTGFAGRWVAAMSHPILDGEGQVKGLLITPIDLNSLADRLAPNTPPGVVVTVLDRKQQVLLRSLELDAWVGKPPPPDVARLYAPGSEGQFRGVDAEGEARLGSAVAIPHAGWLVAAALPEATLLGPVRSSVLRLSALGLLVLGLLFAITQLLYRQIVRSTGTLVDLAGAISAGRTDARAVISGPPELATVATRMNEMLDRLAAGRAETAISVERFRLVADATNSVIWDLDLAQGGLWYSDNVQRLFGYHPVADRALLEDWHALVHPDDREAVREWSGAALAGTAETVSKAYRLRRRDGTYAEIRSHARIVRDSTGQALRVIGAWSDETEYRALDRQLRQFQRLEVVGQLTGGVAHDFNNLLTVILGNVEFLQERLGGQPELYKLAEAVAQAAQRGSDLTRSLLAFSRSQQLSARHIDVAGLVGGLESLLRRALPANISLEIVTEPGLWTIAVDPALFESALLNLCVNARDAMPSGGQVSILVRNHVVSAAQRAAQPDARAGEHVAIRVADQGVGMAPEVLARVFEPFFTTKEPGKGTGLGLSMVYGFVRQSDGFAELASEPGRGTAVTLYFPRSSEPVEDAAATGRAAPLRGGCEHILVVEDDLMVREGAVARLRSLGYRISTAGTAAEALQVLKQAPDIALVLSDIVMPGSMDGRQLARRIRQERPAMRIILTSGYVKDGGGGERLEAGWPFLAKPYRGRDLAAAVRQQLDLAPVPA